MYVLVDIPPALPSAYQRLTKSLKNKNIYFGIDIKNQEDFDSALKNNDIILIFPNQIKFLKKKYFDLLIAIDCLHEMKKDTIKEYMAVAEHTSKKIYFKVHEKAHVPFSFDILNVNSKEDYFIDPNWSLIVKKKSSLFFLTLPPLNGSTPIFFSQIILSNNSLWYDPISKKDL